MKTRTLATGTCHLPLGLLVVWAGLLLPGKSLPAADGPDRSAPGVHWSYQPLVRPPLPVVSGADRARNPIDLFVLSNLERERLVPSQQAEREVLIRRLSLDLIGLPPTPAEVRDFLEDRGANAYERLVDRLLSSPHYGERWARCWLDMCHYADSDGYLTDQARPVAWRYRQWLVEALNANLPFDQFTIQQLAGDLLPGASVDQRMATGFLRQTLSNREGGADPEEFRVEQVVDRLSMVGTIWLGMTVGCARCHDHKYDPISQREFFELYAFFDQADEINIDAPLDDERDAYQAALPEYEEQRRQLIAPRAAEIAELQGRWEARLLEARDHPAEDYRWDRQWELLGLIWGGGLGEGQLEGRQIVQLERSQRTPLQQDRLLDYFLQHGSIIDPARFKELELVELRSKLEALRGELPPVTRAPTMHQTQIPRRTYIHVRGDFRVPGEDVEPSTPAVLPTLDSATRQDRLALARWLVSYHQPLTARVTVNRMWQEFFGTGLVSTSEDFGTRGAQSTHPELLDWLAAEFVDSGWDVKHMHRLLVTSASYRQSSRSSDEQRRRDPKNRWWARQSPLRLSAEQVRDAVLAVSGLLDERIGGPAVFPPQPESVTSEGFDNKWTVSEGGNRYRRGLYTYVQRTSPFAMHITFDGVDPNRSCTRRERSNTPLQALSLLNDPTFVEAARALAARVISERPGGDLQERIDYAQLCCLGRAAEDLERQQLEDLWIKARDLFRKNPSDAAALLPPAGNETDPCEAAAWTAVSSALLNLHEFITRE